MPYPLQCGEHILFFFFFFCRYLYTFLQQYFFSRVFIPHFLKIQKLHPFQSFLWVIFPKFLESLLLLFSGLIPAVHNYFKVCCATLRGAFQLKPLNRLEGLLRLLHMSCKIQFLLSSDLNFFGSHLFFFILQMEKSDMDRLCESSHFTSEILRSGNRVHIC